MKLTDPSVLPRRKATPKATIPGRPRPSAPQARLDPWPDIPRPVPNYHGWKSRAGLTEDELEALVARR